MISLEADDEIYPHTSSWDIFCLTIFHKDIRESKMNAAIRAHLTFQILTWLRKYLYRESQY